jgi:hypothetical protein
VFDVLLAKGEAPPPAGSYKEETVHYLRRLFRRVAEGETTGVIAISPRNVVLIRQLYALRFADDDSGKVEKIDDHGPDALIAGVAPVARRHRKLVELEDAQSEKTS